MERKFWKPGSRAGLGAFIALVVLLAGTGPWIAGDAVAQVPPATPAVGAPLEQGSGHGSMAEAKRVRVLQRALRQRGWAPGRVDGIFGPRTEAAVVRFQLATGLAADGVVGPHTRKALAAAQRLPLRRGAGYATPNGSRKVRALQRHLQRRGLRPGSVDGRYGPKTEAAVARLQRASNLTVSGAVDTRTRRVLGRGTQRGDRNRPVAAKTAVVPQTQGTAAVEPLAEAAVIDNPGNSLSVSLPVGALALIIGALLGGFVSRSRPGTREEQSGHSSREEVQELLPADTSPQQRTDELTVGVTTAPEPVRAVGYVSVPKVNGGEESEALDRQAEAINRLCVRRGWELLHIVRDVENGHPKGMDRPGLLYALERLAEGEASCLVVSQLERLSRSAADLGRIIEWVDERDARLVAIDLRLDTGSAQGRLTARTLVAVGEWEGRRIADQTRKGLAAARARRGTTGRPAVEDLPALKEHIVAMRSQGMTLQAIADRLNEEGIPTLRGGSEWRPSSVQAAAGYRRPKARRSKLTDAQGGESATA
jgi:peptidoglycan hydrolase-like protein with peptidoglycan-binding domain/DNA invertase Pin-like site-specific DNA recombinase